jgi:Domain of unknown function (DUF4166)
MAIGLPLYARVLGQDFAKLPPVVRQLHDVTFATTWQGRADVVRGTNPVARLIATLFGLPPAGPDQALTVTFTPDAVGGETWVRSFAGRRFVSVQTQDGACLCERVGLARLLLRPSASARGLALDLASVHVMGVRMPRFVTPRIVTFESATPEGAYAFAVEARLPGLGLLVDYRGTLAPLRDT